MCLGTVYKGKEKKDALAKLPKSGYYYKVVKYEKFDYDNQRKSDWFNDGKYYPIFFDDNPFRSGWNRTEPKYVSVGYKVAFHLFRSYHKAKRWLGAHEKIIRCIIEKKDIVAIGKQSVDDRSSTVVTTRFWMPKPT